RVASSREGIGLATEADTIELLQHKLAVLVPDLSDDHEGPFEIELIARSHQTVAAHILTFVGCDFIDSKKRLLSQAGRQFLRSGKGDHEIMKFGPIRFPGARSPWITRSSPVTRQMLFLKQAGL